MSYNNEGKLFATTQVFAKMQKNFVLYAKFFFLPQSFHKMAAGSLPAVLRKAMVAKFPDFDEYQLAKYNKEKKKPKKLEKPKVSWMPFGQLAAGGGGSC